jgi:hypothetical protein
MYKLVHILLISFFTILFSNCLLSAQSVKPTAVADSLFAVGKYEQAHEKYKILFQTNPNNPSLAYKLGVSYFYATRNIDKAIENLLIALESSPSSMVHLYLGKSYQLIYNFEKAISHYRQFIDEGGDPSTSKQHVENLISQCENGLFMLKYIYQPIVIDRKRVSKAEAHFYIVTKSESGSFIAKPNDLKTQADIKNNNCTPIFYPNNPKPGDKIVYSSYATNTAKSKDLFIIEMLENGFWSKPKDLGNVINTDLDEDFPYLAPDGVTLYFSSNSHYSMGGLDVYRSIFNPSTRQWSIPENIGFPISSTYNDFFYVPNDDESIATLVSDRNTPNDSVEVFLVRIDENPIRRSIDSPETIKKIASLSPESSNAKGGIYNNSQQQVKTQPQKQQAKTASFSAVENDPEYSRALAQGFSEQIKADSLRTRLVALRERFDYIYTAEDRRALERQVVAVEDALLAAQRNADLQFALASNIEQDYLTGKRKPADKPTSTFTTDKPTFLYQAQFAPTVFQTDELNQLAQAEKIASQVDKIRAEVIELKSKLSQLENDVDYKRQYPTYINRLRSFNQLLSSHIVVKKKIYGDCISVALIKRGATSNLDVRSEIDRANGHFRAATAIRNNATNDSRVESEYEALLLDELGVSRLEVAFAKLWEMRLFEQQLTTKVNRLEQNLFGRSLQKSTELNVASVNNQTDKDKAQQGITTIHRDEVKVVLSDSIVFDPVRAPSFQLLDKSPYNDIKDIPSHDPLPNGVVYKIQLAAFSNPVKISLFKGMVPISAEVVSGGKITKYYAGLFTSLSDAEKALPTVRVNGFKDAFIVAWHNGRSVQPSRAKSLENETRTELPREGTRIDIDNSKLYMIHIGNFPSRLPDDITQTVRAMSLGKDIIRKPDAQGGFIYSVGSYTSLSEATRVKDNLVASGLKNAFVVAVDLDN